MKALKQRHSKKAKTSHTARRGQDPAAGQQDQYSEQGLPTTAALKAEEGTNDPRLLFWPTRVLLLARQALYALSLPPQARLPLRRILPISSDGRHPYEDKVKLSGNVSTASTTRRAHSVVCNSKKQGLLF
jgi:hypothetical protein